LTGFVVYYLHWVFTGVRQKNGDFCRISRNPDQETGKEYVGMSQEKVDLYKEEKKNRKKLMRREKIRTTLTVVAVVAIFGVLIGWFSWAVYNNVKNNQATTAKATTTELDLSAIESYTTALNSYVTEQKTSADSTSADTSSESTSDSSEAASTSADSSASSTSAASSVSSASAAG
jgi:Tfp pilus assembly protein PilE